MPAADHRLDHGRYGTLQRRLIGCNPGALLFSKPIDSLAAAGAILASVWTPNGMPTVDNLGDEFLDYVKDGMEIKIHADGTVEAE